MNQILSDAYIAGKISKFIGNTGLSADRLGVNPLDLDDVWSIYTITAPAWRRYDRESGRIYGALVYTDESILRGTIQISSNMVRR